VRQNVAAPNIGLGLKADEKNDDLTPKTFLLGNVIFHQKCPDFILNSF
jgi:hypothetical protein